MRSLRWLAPIVSALCAVSAAAAASGPVGAEFQVNTYTSEYQRSPAVAADGAGDFVVVWRAYGIDGDTGGTFARRYDASGAPQGGEFQVNSYTTGAQVDARVASSAAGDFVVVWTSFPSQDGDDLGVFGQRYDGAGVPQGVEFQVNTYTTGLQGDPAVASDTAGNFVVVWVSEQDGDYIGIFGQRYNSMGVAQGSEFLVNSYTTGGQHHPAVASDGAGNFVVAWTNYGQIAGDISARRYDSAGVPQGPEFLVNTYTTLVQRSPEVAVGPGGNFVVVWDSIALDGVSGQRYDSAGVPQGSEFQVNAYPVGAAVAPNPRVAFDATGSFVVTWANYAQDGSPSAVSGRRYDSSGVPVGGEFRANNHTADIQDEPAVAAWGAGNFVLAWESLNQDGHNWGVFGRRHAAVQPITGGKLLIKENADPTKRKIVFTSKDPRITTRAGLGIDPVSDGATLHVYNNEGSGDSACFGLPNTAASWQSKGASADPVFSYRDSDFVNGPCKVVLVRPGKLLKATCKANVQPISYSLDEAAQTSVAIDFVSGSQRYCAVFGAGAIGRYDQNRLLRGRNAPAPAVCPTPPVSCP